MRDATHDTWFGENKTDFEYPEANVEISNEQVFVEVLRTVRERARLRIGNIQPIAAGSALFRTDRGSTR